ncbi:MAG: winged helix-turn-helix transcriptional regulator [Myxococcales bacterium]|nr:winged helix-turn-helix transcriptional regulator [Myxococcales bacterium]MCB9530956.1 winged helix-turn-helix transcriptional regulator [Myxococcales bacterium]MCB9532876.1 winged helix-turn-helix transcriptional regulator [Myxococcales bacterium]
MATKTRIRSPRLVFDVEMLRAMGDDTRQQVLQLLCTPGAGKMLDLSVSDIAQQLELSVSTASHHLQLLRRANLVTVRRAGKERRYALDFENLRRSVGQFNDLLGLIETTVERVASAENAPT